MKSGFEYVFQNYIYVPIISAIIGAIFSMLVPKLFIWIGKKIKDKVNDRYFRKMEFFFS